MRNLFNRSPIQFRVCYSVAAGPHIAPPDTVVIIIIIIMINRPSGNDDWPGGEGGTSSIIKEALGDGMCGFIIIFGSYSVRDKCGCILLLASQPPPRAVDQWRSLISLVA